MTRNASIKQVLCLLACTFTVLMPVLSSCEKSANAPTGTTGVTEEAVSTTGEAVSTTEEAASTTGEITEATRDPQETTPPVTTGGVITDIPTDLEVKAIRENMIVGRSVPGVTVSIDENTTIKLSTYSWPTVTKDENGVLYVSASFRYSHVDPYGCTAFMKSTDNGMSWTAPRIINDTPADDRDSGIVYLGNGRLLVSWFNHKVQNYIDGPEEYTHWQELVTPQQKEATLNKLNNLSAEQKIQGSWVMLSEDYGETWGDPIRVPVTSPHGPTLMRDGKTLMYMGNPTGSDLVPGFEQMGAGIHLITSTDGGRTWSYRSSLNHAVFGTSYYGEPNVIQLDDGSFLAAVRTRSTKSFATLYIARSEDGYTWTDPQPLTPEIAGAPAHFLQLSNGVVVMSYSCRNMIECGSRMRLSYDRGETWTEEMIINIGHQPGNGDNGYPTSIELGDGTILTVYYQCYTADKTPSVLWTRWKLVPASNED